MHALVLLASTALAAPLSGTVHPGGYFRFPYVVTAELPQEPATLPGYRFVPTDAGDTLLDLEGTLGFSGLDEKDDAFGGTWHVNDAGDQLFAFGNGGCSWLPASMPLAPMTPLGDDAAYHVAGDLLADLGLFDLPGVDLVPAGVQRLRIDSHNADGKVIRRWVAAQAVGFQATIDGWPTFGGGGSATVQLGVGGEPVGLTSGLRGVEPTGEIEILDPAAAIQAWASQADATGRWLLLKTATPNVQRVEIQSVTLGYFLSDVTAAAPAVTPIYALEGTVTYAPTNGQTETTPFLWYQAAEPGAVVPDLNPTF